MVHRGIRAPVFRIQSPKLPYLEERRDATGSVLNFSVDRAHSSDPASVWERVSDLTNMPRYWHGQKGIALVKKAKDVYEATVDFAFGGRGMANVRVDEENRSVLLEYSSGPFTGTQEIVVRGGRVSATWNVRFVGIYRLLERFNKKHFRTGTEHALERLCQS